MQRSEEEEQKLFRDHQRTAMSSFQMRTGRFVRDHAFNSISELRALVETPHLLSRISNLVKEGNSSRFLPALTSLGALSDLEGALSSSQCL